MIHQGKQSFSKFFQEEEINKLDLKKKKHPYTKPSQLTAFSKPCVDVKIMKFLDLMKKLEFLPTVHYWMITEDPDQLWFCGNAGDHLSWWTHAHSFPACSSPHLELASITPLLLRSISKKLTNLPTHREKMLGLSQPRNHVGHIQSKDRIVN